jgi:hypothetical protein
VKGNIPGLAVELDEDGTEDAAWLVVERVSWAFRRKKVVLVGKW